METKGGYFRFDETALSQDLLDAISFHCGFHLPAAIPGPREPSCDFLRMESW